MNNLSLIGNLTRDPQLRYTPTGKPVCELRLAVNGIANTPPMFIDVATYGPQAQAAARHLTKGRQVAVTARLVYREWTASDGTKRSRHSAVGRVEFLGAPPADAGAIPGDEDDAAVAAVMAVADEETTPNGAAKQRSRRAPAGRSRT